MSDSSMFSKAFWVETAERMAKSAAQWALGSIVLSDTGMFNLFTLDWQYLLGFAAGGAFLSFLTCIISAPFAPKGSASLVPTPGS